VIDPVNAPTVRRLDDRMGLAVERVIVSARTVVTYTRDHVIVRTPSHPNDTLGNTLDLVGIPDVNALPVWVKRFADTIGMIGASTTRLRFEHPADLPAPEPVLAWLRDQHFTVQTRTVHLKDAAPPRGRVSGDIRLLGDQPVGADQILDRMWFAADVLDKYRRGSEVSEYVVRSDSEYTETTAVLREHVVAQRARMFVAYRYGTPVGRIAATHDRQGLVVLHALVVHPAHRRRGIGTALMAAGLAGYDTQEPKVRFGASVPTGNAARALLEHETFIPHAIVYTAERS